MKIGVCSRSFSNNADLVNLLKKYFKNIKLNKSSRLNGTKLIKFLKDCDVAIVGLEKINKNVLENCYKLKFISKFGVGLDNLDFYQLKKFKIGVGFSKNLNSESVTELVILAMLYKIRLFKSNLDNAKNFKWKPNIGENLSSKKIGIIGYGNIGRLLYRKLKSFCPQIYVNEINKKKMVGDINFKSKSFIFENCDIISLNTDLNIKTKNMINKKTLSKMKKNCLIINTSRGEVINESHFYEHLTRNPNFNCFLDVMTNEQILNKKLIKLANVCITPHIGGSTSASIKKMGLASIKKVLNYVERK